MIPNLVEVEGAPWRVLPVGVHAALLSEVEETFALNHRRRDLFRGLIRACIALNLAGCRYVYIDGSYVTAKPFPGDYDVCWDPNGVMRARLDPTFLDFRRERAAQKSKYGGEFFPLTSAATPDGTTFLEFFQIERFSAGRKGIVRVDLATDPSARKEVSA